MFQKEVFKTFTFWIGVGLILLTVLATITGNQQGHWFSSLIRTKFPKEPELWMLASVDLVKWFPGFVGLVAIGLYNLHRADKKDARARQADFVYKWSAERIELAVSIRLRFQDLNKVLDRKRMDQWFPKIYLSEEDEAQKKRERDRLPTLEEVNDDLFRLALTFGKTPTRVNIPNRTLAEWVLIRASNLQVHEINQRFDRPDSPEEVAGLELEYGKDAGDVYRHLEAIIEEERYRQFVCSKDPYEKWPDFVKTDLAFLGERDRP